MATYEVTTEDGVYEVETEDSPNVEQKDNSIMDLAVGGLPSYALPAKDGDKLPLLASTVSALTGGSLRSAIERPKQTAMGGGLVFSGAEQGVDLLKQILSERGVTSEIDNPYRGNEQFPKAKTAKGSLGQLLLESAGPAALEPFLSIKRSPKASDIEEMVSTLDKNSKYKSKLIEGSKKLAIDSAASEFDLKELQAKQRLNDLRRNSVSIRQSHQDQLAVVNSSIQEIDSKATNAARNLTLKSREIFPSYAKKVSDEYGQEITKAGAGVEIPFNDLKQSIGNSMQRGYLKTLFDKMTFAPESLSSEDKKVLSYVQRIREMEGVDRIPLLSLDKEIQGIVGKPGKQYSSAQRSLTELRRIFVDAAGDANKELSLVKAKFRPKLQFKDKLFEIADPFNPQGPLDTSKGTSYFKKIVDGDITQDDVDFGNLFDKEIGSGFTDEIKDLSSKKLSARQAVLDIKKAYQDQSRNIISEKFKIDDFLKSNESQKESAISKVAKDFDVEALNQTAKEGNARKSLNEQLNKAESGDFGRKIIRFAVKEGIKQLKRNVKGF